MTRFLFLTAVCLLIAVDSAEAQFDYQNRAWSIMSNNRGPSAASRILSSSAVSPYLALTDLSGGAGATNVTQNYFSIVKPRLEAERMQRQQQRSIAQLQQTVTSMRSAATPANRSGARITGHPTRFGNYLQYYPALGRRR